MLGAGAAAVAAEAAAAYSSTLEAAGTPAGEAAGAEAGEAAVGAAGGEAAARTAAEAGLASGAAGDSSCTQSVVGKPDPVAARVAGEPPVGDSSCPRALASRPGPDSPVAVSQSTAVADSASTQAAAVRVGPWPAADPAGPLGLDLGPGCLSHARAPGAELGPPDPPRSPHQLTVPFTTHMAEASRLTSMAGPAVTGLGPSAESVGAAPPSGHMVTAGPADPALTTTGSHDPVPTPPKPPLDDMLLKWVSLFPILLSCPLSFPCCSTWSASLLSDTHTSRFFSTKHVYMRISLYVCNYVRDFANLCTYIRMYV